MIITVEGNIGSGKTTFLDLCGSLTFSRPAVVLCEKVDEWIALKDPVTGKSIFEMFYDDKAKNAYLFQTYVLFSRVKHMMETVAANPGSIVLCERGILTDIEVFAKTMRDTGDMSSMDWTAYESWHGLVRQVLCHDGRMDVRGQIYLRADPETSLARIARRGRVSEDAIDHEYVRILHERHDAWLLAEEDGGDGGAPSTRTLVLDVNQDFYSDEALLADVRNKVVSFVEETLALDQPESLAQQKVLLCAR